MNWRAGPARLKPRDAGRGPRRLRGDRRGYRGEADGKQSEQRRLPRDPGASLEFRRAFSERASSSANEDSFLHGADLHFGETSRRRPPRRRRAAGPGRGSAGLTGAGGSVKGMRIDTDGSSLITLQSTVACFERCVKRGVMRETIGPRRKPGPPKTGVGHAVGVRLHPELEARLDAWIVRQAVPVTRPLAIRILIERALDAER